MRFPARIHQSIVDHAIQQLRNGRPGEFGYGRRVALLLTIPMFEDPVARDVRRTANGDLYVVRTTWNRALDFASSSLKVDARAGLARLAPATLLLNTLPGPSLHSTRVHADTQAIDALLETVASSTIACRPQHADAPLDATIFELTFGEELTETRYRWSGSAPAGWEPLAQFATRLVRIIDEPAGVPVR
jgi:hypothetical protein